MIPRIISKGEKDRRIRKTKIWLSAAIAAMMLISTAGFAYLSANPGITQKYNGFKFDNTDKGWKARDLNIYTSYLPQEVEDIDIKGINPSVQDFSSKVYLITDPPTNQLPEFSEFPNTLPIGRINKACLPKYENDTLCQSQNLLLMDCSNAGPELQGKVIIIKESNETSVTYAGNCLEISGQGSEIVRAIDRIVYAAYGVMD